MDDRAECVAHAKHWQQRSLTPQAALAALKLVLALVRYAQVVKAGLVGRGDDLGMGARGGGGQGGGF